jgi:hypothetical protein
MNEPVAAHELHGLARLVRDHDAVCEYVAVFDHVGLVWQIQRFDLDADTAGDGRRHAESKPKAAEAGKSRV